MSDASVRFLPSEESFHHIFATYCSTHERPVVERVSLFEDNSIELYALFLEVLICDGYLVTTRLRQWPMVAARLGLIDHPARWTAVSAESRDIIGSQLQQVYDVYLFNLECWAIEDATRGIVTEWAESNAVGHLPNDAWALMDDLLNKIPFSPEELSLQNVSPSVFELLEHTRPLLWHVLRNRQECHRRTAMLAPLDGKAADKCARPTSQPVPSSSPAEPRGSSRKGRTGASLPRAEEDGSEPFTSGDPTAAHTSDPRASAQNRGHSTPSSSQAPHDQPIPYQSILKPFVALGGARSPSPSELSQAAAWIEVVKQEFARKAGQRSPARTIPDPVWPVFYGLFNEVFQEISSLFPRLPSLVCMMHEEAAHDLVCDMLLVMEQRRCFDGGSRMGLLTVQRLSSLRDWLRLWASLEWSPQT
ncbi:uncharacterized protein C8Q71DRAFT_412897 [Rhodofomes roseus]|uniref:ARID domain-containing protein n=1 Tax=Rhodofomes roseus TaxID=34475 RepID=A0ABQ8KPM2_9APHY|nr:uncharacterized protein C8Q71DRAFT_412897 [Rhodofomes roseus]KAH9840556.1 hypothetical protein C8Q71DRAFT_412897 [Rhodofomes roseus]